MIIAVIPARGGSKRIPGKNIRSFCGRPIIEYSIAAAQESSVFDRIVVSTDCPQIAEVAKECGAEVPFTRPKELSDDFTSTAPVIAYAAEQLQLAGDPVEFICGIYPTAPFLRVDDLRDGLATLRDSDAESVIPVTTYDFTIYRGVGILESGDLELLWPDMLRNWREHETTRSNDLPEAYHDVGQFYWLRASSFLRGPRLWWPNTRPLIVPRKYAVDIDTPEDWEIAELKFNALNSERAND